MIKLLKFLMPVNDREADRAIAVIKDIPPREYVKFASVIALAITIIPILLVMLPVQEHFA